MIRRPFHAIIADIVGYCIGFASDHTAAIFGVFVESMSFEFRVACHAALKGGAS